MTAAQDQALKQAFLGGMSHAAATVNVVTTDGPAGRFGVTVSAMSSVSADTEKPTLLVCVNESSSTAQPIIDNGVFCVNVLRDDQAWISDCFAGRYKTADGDKFSCTTWATQKTGAPRVVNPLVAFDCRLINSMKIGTHYVFFGAVEDIYTHEAGSPLIYANRAYGTPLKLAPAQRSTSPGSPQILRLGAYHTFAPYVVPDVVARLAASHPDLKLELIEGDQRRIIEALKSDTIDVALVHDFWELDPSLTLEKLVPLEPYVLLAQGDPLAEKPSLSLAELSAHPMVLLDAHPGGDMALGLFKERGLEPNVRFRTTLFEMVRGMVGNGLGYSILTTKPAFNMTYDGRPLTSRPLTDAIAPRHMALAFRREKTLEGLAAEFAALCRAPQAAAPKAAGKSARRKS